MSTVYKSFAQIGKCHLCEQIKDLRMGVCFKCSDKVDGYKSGPNTFTLYEKDNRENCWFVTTSEQ